MTCPVGGSPALSPMAALRPVSGKATPEAVKLVRSPSASPLPSPGTRLPDPSLRPTTSRRGGGQGLSVMKRKRPARINVPMAEVFAEEAGAVSDGRREVQAEEVRYAVYCRRGKGRLEMEDRHATAVGIAGESETAFFGVFDGHGGPRAAEFVSQNMADVILEEVHKRDGGRGEEIECAVRTAYLRVDKEFLKEETVGGACCVTALLRSGNLVVSNAGDCRAVLCRGGKAEALSSDHRPSRVDERERIESSGGFVMNCSGVWRVQGVLAVTRAIGHPHLKEWVIPEPETRTIQITRECEFLILASDGLWDKVGNQEVVDIARTTASSNHSLLSACKKLVEVTASRGSMDDISVMIVPLQNFL